MYYGPPRRGIAPRIDLYLPTAPGPASALLVHGGGFVVGSRRMKPMRLLASRLCAAGVAVGVVDYRLIFRGGRLDEALEDVAAGLAWFAAWASRHGRDPRRLSMVGLSAGGMLALLAASRPSVPLHRLVSCFGLYDVDHLTGLPGLLPRLLFGTTDREAWRARSPLAAAQPSVPTLLLHGTADGLVPIEQAHRLAARRQAAGLPTELVTYPGAPHGFFNLPSQFSDDGVRRILAYVT